MNAMLRKSLIAGFVATLASTPAWSAGSGTDSTSDTYRSDKSGQTMERGTTSGTTGQSSTGMATHSSALYSMTPDQIESMDVVGAAGEDIGDVKAVVRSRTQDNIQVVVSAGGFLGVGDRDIAVPLDQLQLVGDKLQLSATKEELKARPEYVEEQFVELEPTDQPISDFAAFEPTPGQESQQQRSGQGDQLPPAHPNQGRTPNAPASPEVPSAN